MQLPRPPTLASEEKQTQAVEGFGWWRVSGFRVSIFALSFSGQGWGEGFGGVSNGMQGLCTKAARTRRFRLSGPFGSISGFWSTIREYFFGVPVPLRNHYEIKSLYFFLPGYFKVQICREKG